MKNTIIGILVIGVLGGGAYYFLKNKQPVQTESETRGVEEPLATAPIVTGNDLADTQTLKLNIKSSGVAGFVLSASATSLSVKRDTGSDVYSLTTSSNTKYFLDGKPATYAAAKSGMMVIVSGKVDATTKTGTAEIVNLLTKITQ